MKLDCSFVRQIGMDPRTWDRDVPDSFKYFYPRRYVEPATHFSPKIAALTAALEMESLPDVEMSAMTEWELACTSRLLQHGIPTWWVGAELFESLLNTEPPASIKLNEIKWPVPALQFMLPIKESRKAFGRNVAVLAGSNWPVNAVLELPKNSKGYKYRCCLAAKQPAIMHSFIIMGSCYHLDGNIDGTLSMHLPLVDGTTVGDMMTKHWPEGFIYDSIAQPNPTDVQRMDMFVAMFIQLVLLLGMKREVMETGGNLLIGAKTEGKGEDKKIITPSLFAPRWVGQYYKRPRKPDQGGTHASPEMHLRTGHWRDQRVGPGRTTIKPIWIQETWVNAEQEGDV